MDRKPHGPMSQMFYVLADQLSTRLTNIGCTVKLATDQMTMSYTATVTTPQGTTGTGSDWSPVAAIEKAYADAHQLAQQKEVVQL